MSKSDLESNILDEINRKRERVFKYRHPLPTEKKIGEYVLLHSAVRKWGLHANVIRIMSFKKISEDINRRFEAACRIATAAISMCNQAFDWFVTITGVKVEELSINTNEGIEICSIRDNWLTKQYEYNGKAFNLPQILCR